MSLRSERRSASNLDYIYVNENEIDTELKCAICQQPFVNPQLGVKCGHTFCALCINNWSRQNLSCPLCRIATSFVPVTTRVVLSQLDRLLVRCPQCNQSNIQRGNFHDHINNQCRETHVQCQAADLKCSWSGTREQWPQHHSVCPLVKIRPIVEELRSEHSAQAYQLQVFMDEVRDQLSYLQQQLVQKSQVKATTHDQYNEDKSEKELYAALMNDMVHTWSRGSCYDYEHCKFCRSKTKRLTCLLCRRPAARQNISTHDSSGEVDDVLCRACIDKYDKDFKNEKSMYRK